MNDAQRAKLGALLTVAAPPTGYPTDDAEEKRQKLMAPCYNAVASTTNCLNAQLNVRSGLFLDQDLAPCSEDGANGPECAERMSTGNARYVAARDKVADAGIFVREPVVGRLLFCREALLPSSTGVAVPAAVAPNGVAPAPDVDGGTTSDGADGGTLEGDDSSSGRQPGATAGNPPRAAPPPAPPLATPDPVCTVGQDETKIAAGDFPQFGQLRFFPFRVGTFQAREMAIALTEAGRIETFSYKSTKAPAEVFAGTAADVAGQLETWREKRETEARDDLKYAREQEFAEIQQEITRLTKEQELKKLRTPPEVDPLKASRDETAAITADIALLEAKLKRLQAEAALAAMTGGSAP